jgi:hypothetical protein
VGVDVRLVTREEWGALPAKGSSGLFAPGWGDFLIVHYTGITARPDPTEFEQKAEYLRGLQRYYQSGAHPGGGPGGFVDVGYNFACWNDDEPAIWELRGLRMRGGANGTASSNAVRPSCLIVADVNEGVHPAVPRKMAWLVQMIRDQSQRQTGTRGHLDEFNTGCPGELIYPLVTSGAFLPENQTGPTPTPEPPTEDEDDMRGWQDKRFKNVFHAATGLCVAPAEVAGMTIAVEDPGHDPKLAACCRASWGIEGSSPAEVVQIATARGYLLAS